MRGLDKKNRRRTGLDYRRLAGDIKTWAQQLGFSGIGITGVALPEDEARLRDWLERGFHGAMDYMERHGTKRSRPAELMPGTVRVIAVRMDYLKEPMAGAHAVLADPRLGYVSRYALGRDYHRVLRGRLRRLVSRIDEVAGPSGHRVFADSAPVLEKALARNAGLGWIGKHSNLISRDRGSWFFLGEVYTDLPLPIDPPQGREHCGRCTACMAVCPTAAIVAPYQVDARLCISYLTIELRGPIPVALRPLVGNRIYGCDDCQIACPWNRFARLSCERDFAPRHGLDAPCLTDLFSWGETEFGKRTEGSAIRRIGYSGWLRNIAVALGNAPTTPAVVEALASRASDPSDLVREHVQWALSRHGA